jgi:hypothetical protein
MPMGAHAPIVPIAIAPCRTPYEANRYLMTGRSNAPYIGHGSDCRRPRYYLACMARRDEIL